MFYVFQFLLIFSLCPLFLLTPLGGTDHWQVVLPLFNPVARYIARSLHVFALFLVHFCPQSVILLLFIALHGLGFLCHSSITSISQTRHAVFASAPGLPRPATVPPKLQGPRGIRGAVPPLLRNRKLSPNSLHGLHLCTQAAPDLLPLRKSREGVHGAPFRPWTASAPPAPQGPPPTRHDRGARRNENGASPWHSPMLRSC